MFNKNTKQAITLSKQIRHIFHKKQLKTDQLNIQNLLAKQLFNKNTYLLSQIKITNKLSQIISESKDKQIQINNQQYPNDNKNFLSQIDLSRQNQMIVQNDIQKLKQIKPEYFFMTQNALSWQVKINRMKNNFQKRVQKSQINENRIFQHRNKIVLEYKSNPYLSNGNLSEYKYYPLLKLTQIALKFLQNHDSIDHEELYSKQGYDKHWCELQQCIRKRMHNCSLKQYLKILYIQLQSYYFYHFDPKFISNILYGINKQIPLMQQTQSAQCFYLLSNRNRNQFDLYQIKRKFGIKQQKLQKFKFNPNLFQNSALQNLQDKIIQKVIIKYKKKYLNTHLNFKQDDFVKICFWIEMIISYRNTNKFAQQNRVSTKYLLQLLQVLLSKMSNKDKNIQKKSNNLLLQNKFLNFKSFGQLVQIFEILKNCYQYISYQADNSQSSDRYEQYIYVNLKTKQVIKNLLNYENIKTSIQIFLKNNQIQNDLKILKNKIIDKQLSKWKILRILIDSKPIHQFLAQYNLLSQFQFANQIIVNIQKDQVMKERLLEIGQIQLQILYQFWNNSSLIQFQQNNTNSFKFYQQIINNFFKYDSKYFMINKIKPQTYYKMIVIQISQYFNHLNQNNFIAVQPNKQIQNYQILQKKLLDNFIAKDFILQYSKTILGQLEQNKKAYYIRQIQWFIYNYLKLVHKNTKRIIQYSNQLTISDEQKSLLLKYQEKLKKIDIILQQIQSRNKKISQYIQQKSDFMNFNNSNRFLMISANHNANQLALKNQKIKQNKSFSKEQLFLSQKIIQILQIQRKQYYKDQDLVKIDKFFTEIKAFDLIKLGVPVTNFNLSCQFICSYKNNKNIYEKNHILTFYKSYELVQKSKKVQQILFELNNYNYDVIDSEKFLKMHINQRVQLLKQILLKGVQKKNSRRIQQKNNIQEVVY